jgi:SLAP domain-containing protein
LKSGEKMPYTLVLHPKWQEAVSKQDLDLFERLVETIKDFGEGGVRYISAKVAKNYQNDLLATVLIINDTDEKIFFNQIVLEYDENNTSLASNVFTLPTLIVEPKTIMPWTFIFPADTVQGNPQFENWKITMVKK